MPVEVDHLRSKISSPDNNTFFCLTKKQIYIRLHEKKFGIGSFGGKFTKI